MMYVKKQASGYDVQVHGNALHLKPAEAEKLITALLSEMPNIPERLKIAWNMQSDPRGKVVKTFKFEEGAIREYYHLEIFIPNHRGHSIYTGPESLYALDAILQGYAGYGDGIEVVELVTDMVSKKIAEQEYKRANVAKTVMAKYGMTMQEIIKYLGKHKVLPPEVTT